MLRAALKRSLALVPLLLLVSLGSFVLLDLAPSDAARVVAGENASETEIQAARERLGLDDSIPVRYARWVRGVASGDLGTSIHTGQPVAGLITSRLSVTGSLLVVAMTIAVVTGLGGGFLIVLWQGSAAQKLLTLVTSVGIAIPQFWLGLVLVLVFALNLRWFPAIGYTPLTENPVEWLRHLVLPGLALAAVPAATLSRQFSASLSDMKQREFVLAAAAKGLPNWLLTAKHAGKNAGATTSTLTALQVSRILGGTIIVEQVFSLRGLGSMATNGVFNRDVPVVLGVVIVMTVGVLLANFAADLAQLYFNPRTRDA